MRKFGAPETCIRIYPRWCVQLRGAQVTLGSLILSAFEPVRAFPALSRDSFLELQEVVREVETALKSAFEYDKLNYLMLMMVDPDVHFHIIPRYARPREFEGDEFIDAGWPGPPELGRVNKTDDGANRRIIEHITACWP